MNSTIATLFPDGDLFLYMQIRNELCVSVVFLSRKAILFASKVNIPGRSQ